MLNLQKLKWLFNKSVNLNLNHNLHCICIPGVTDWRVIWIFALIIDNVVSDNQSFKYGNSIYNKLWVLYIVHRFSERWKLEYLFNKSVNHDQDTASHSDSDSESQSDEDEWFESSLWQLTPWLGRYEWYMNDFVALSSFSAKRCLLLFFSPFERGMLRCQAVKNSTTFSHLYFILFPAIQIRTYFVQFKFLSKMWTTVGKNSDGFLPKK